MSTQRVVIGVLTAGAIGIAAPLIEKVEGVEYKPYKDIAGVWTVCAGITGPDVTRGKVYTKTDCRKLLEKHIAIHGKYVEDAIKIPVHPNTRAALISFSYSVGGNAMRKSTAVKLINQGKIEQGCKALASWNKATINGKKVVVKGLVNRRNEEIKLCLSGLQR